MRLLALMAVALTAAIAVILVTLALPAASPILADAPIAGQSTITTSADAATYVYAADVDGDGDMDVLSASFGDATIAWFENTAGDGSAWTANTISTSAVGAISVYAADVDGDGDMDALSASNNDDKIAWYENTAGDGSAWTANTISTSAAIRATSVYAADVDRDGDMDVLSASANDDKIAWYENTAGDGSAWTARTISTSAAIRATSVYAADVDGDGDMDALSASFNDDKVAWYENKGGQFALTTTDTAPATLDQGTTDDMLKIVATHRGRTGDTDLELVTLDLIFEESASDTLTSAEANAIIENLLIYRDDGSGTFESGSDTLVTTVSTLALTAGKQKVTFNDADTNVQVPFGTPKTYFVVVDLTSNAASQTPDQVRVTHVTETTSTAEDRDKDIALSLELRVTLPPAPSQPPHQRQRRFSLA